LRFFISGDFLFFVSGFRFQVEMRIGPAMILPQSTQSYRKGRKGRKGFYTKLCELCGKKKRNTSKPET
jgi:hypothetical protein